MAVEITTDNFDEIVLNSDKPVMVDFWATWCGPCRMVGPIMDELHNDYTEKAVIGKVNIDEQNEIAMKYGIRNIPTVLIFKGGEIVDKQVGAAPKSAYQAKLDSQI